MEEEKLVKTSLFLQNSIKQKMKLVAKKNHRSFAKEINHALEQYLKDVDVPIQKKVVEYKEELKVEPGAIEKDVFVLGNNGDMEDF